MKKFLNFSRTASSELQNKINISIIFNYLREKNLISRAKISNDLNDRENYNKWSESGSKSLKNVINDKTKEILKSHTDVLPEMTIRQINKVLEM